jgi:hypothetical protein
VAKPTPQRSPSQHLDLNGLASLAIPNGANGTAKIPNIVQSLEAKADEM